MSKFCSNPSINYLPGKEKKIRIENGKNPKVFNDYSQTTVNVYGSLEDYNPKKIGNVLIVFGHMIADMKANKKLSPIVTELFMKDRKQTFHLFFYQNPISKSLKI